MAITVNTIRYKSDTLGNTTILFATDSSTITPISAKIYYHISNISLSNYNSVDNSVDNGWVELGDARPDLTIQWGERYIHCDETLMFDTLVGKYIYFKITGTDTNGAYEWKKSLSGSGLLSHAATFSDYDSFSLNGTNLTYNGISAPNTSGIMYQQSSYPNTSCIDYISYEITFDVDGTEVVKTLPYSLIGDKTLTNISPSSRVFIKKTRSIMKLKYKADAIIYESEPKYILYYPSLVQSNVEIIKTFEVDVVGVHGSFLYDGYLYGSGRYQSQKSFVKINVNDTSDTTYLKIYDNGTNIEQLEQIVHDGIYMYALGANGSKAYVVKVKMSDLTYSLYTLPFECIGVPIGLSDNKLYIHEDDNPHGIYVYDINDLNSTETVSEIPPPILHINADAHVSIPSKHSVHSLILDDEHLYSAYTTFDINSISEAPNAYNLLKFNKSDLSFVSSVLIPKATDDMSDNKDYLFFGQEVSDGKLGDTYGSFAVRKSDLVLLPLSYLSKSDIAKSTVTRNIYRSPTSYASIRFGGNLIDSKTNYKIYNLDTSNVDNWNDDNPGEFTLNEYTYPNSHGVINEFDYDYNTNIFHGFGWVSGGLGRSKYIAFKLPGLNVQNVPMTSALSYNLNGDEFTFTCSILSSGGQEVTSAKINIYGSDNILLDTIDVSDVSNGVKTITYTPLIQLPDTFFAKFIATNIIGDSNMEPLYIDIAVVETPIIPKITGQVLYGYDNTPVSGVTVYIIDMATNIMISSTTTDSVGVYLFENLTMDSNYMLCGYLGEKRIISKILKPF